MTTTDCPSAAGHGDPARSLPAAEGFRELVLGPEDVLVLQAKRPVDHEVIEQMAKRIPERLHGRVVIVAFEDFDVAVGRREAW